MTAESAPVSKGNWPIGVIAAIGAGLIGSIIYAAVIAYTDEGTEIGYLAILIGFLAAIALVKVGKVSGMAAAVVAAVIAFVCWAFALELGIAWWSAQQGYGSIFSNLGDLLPESWNLLKAYFEADAMGYLFAVLAAGSAVVTVIRVDSKK